MTLINLSVSYDLDDSEDLGLVSLALADALGEQTGVTSVTITLGHDPRPFAEREYDD